jgi:hypothetical protein
MQMTTTSQFEQTTYATGSGPFSVAVGDLNGDGKLDIVTANANDNTVSVLLGNGDGTYRPQATYGTGPGPLSVAIGDLNGDGKPDLVVANGNSFSTDSVLLGNGDGTFQPQTTVVVGESHQVVIGDLNGDGKLDLVNANSNSGTVSVNLGNGDGTFQPRTTYAVEPGFGGSGPISVAIGDVNGDGKPDLVTADYSENAVSVLLGNGDGTFQAPTSYAAGSQPGLVQVADLNGDGRQDIVVANQTSNNVSVLLGNGDGTFQPETTYSVGAGQGFIRVADVNGDGKPDIVALDNGGASVLLGNGDGTFQPATFYATGSGPSSVAIGDVNGDGKPDIITSNLNSNNISVLLNGNDSTEQAALKLTVGNTNIGSSTASAVPFTIAGLDPEDSGTVTFTDVNNKTVPVNVTASQTSYTANLTSLADGTITTSLAVNTDPAGNSFTPVAGNTVTPVAFYSFDESSGTVANDQQGGQNGTIIGTTHVPGITGNALQFDGPNPGYVSVPNSPDWNFGSGDFSIQAWANFSSVPTGTAAELSNAIVAHDDGAGSQNKWVLDAYSGHLGFHINNTSAGFVFLEAPFIPTPGQWYLIDLSKSGSTYQFYVNGTLIGTAAGSAVMPDASAPLTIGFANDGSNGIGFGGELDDVGIYHSALSQTEVAQIYQAGLAGKTIYPADTVTLDRDTLEQSALSLTVNGRQPISAATASAVPFTAVGFESDDNGSVSFSDGSHAPVVVAITNGVLAATTANLAGLNDGPITGTLHLSNDAAGNSFTDVTTGATLDTDRAFTPVLKVDGGTANVLVDAKTAKVTPVTVTGMESGDTGGTVTFTDAAGHTKTLTGVSASQTSYTVDLSSLTDGAITSSLLVTDSSGNRTTGTGNPVTLDQDSAPEPPTLTFAKGMSFTVHPGSPVSMGITVNSASLDGDDNVSVKFSGVVKYLTITAGDGVVQTGGGTYTFTAADVNSGLTLSSNNPKNPLITSPTVTATNNTTGTEKSSSTYNITITDPPAASGPSTNPHSLSDLMSQFGSHDASGAPNQLSGGRVDSPPTNTNGPIPNLAALTESWTGAPFVSGGASGLLPNSLLAEEQRGFLALHPA